MVHRGIKYNLISDLNGHKNAVHALAIFSNTNIVSSSDDNTIKIWNSNSFEVIATLNAHNSLVESLAILPNGYIVSGSRDRTIKVWKYLNYIQ